jgi:hypothetical protein
MITQCLHCGKTSQTVVCAECVIMPFYKIKSTDYDIDTLPLPPPPKLNDSHPYIGIFPPKPICICFGGRARTCKAHNEG